MIEDPNGGTAFDGTTLNVHTKGGTGHFGCPYGSCPHPRCIWRIRITPEGVDDLGYCLAEPEFQLLDDVVSGILQHRSVSHLASPRAAATFREIIHEELGADPDAGFVLEGAERRQVPNGVRFTLLTECRGEVEFLLTRRGTRLYINDVKMPGWRRWQQDGKDVAN